MLNKFRNKVLSAKKIALRQPVKIEKSSQKSKALVFSSSLEAARYYEEVGDWFGAASSWENHINQARALGLPSIGDLIEYYYAMLKVRVGGGVNDRSTLTVVYDEIVSAISTGKDIDVGRSSVFKGIDILLCNHHGDMVAQFLQLAKVNLEEDAELREKYLSDVLNVTTGFQWVWSDNVTQQRIDVFNNVVIDYCIKNAERSHIGLFYQIKKYAADCLARGATPSISIIRNIIIGSNSFDGIFAPVDYRCGAGKINAFLKHSVLDIVTSLVVFHPALVLDIAARSKSDGEFERAVKRLSHLIPRYCVITKLGYPMGGGESFMHQSCAILREFGFENIWVSFTDKDGNPYSAESTTKTPYYLDVRLIGGLSDSNVAKAIADYGVDLLHTQGISNEVVAKCAKEARIPCFVGFHFWNGLVELGFTSNKNILAKAAYHRSVDFIASDRDITKYVASEFMLDVFLAVGGKENLEVFHPIPDPSHFSVKDLDRNDAIYVTQINLAHGKGGGIFLACLDKLASEGIPFLGVHSETVDDELLSSISRAVKKSPKSRLEGYGPAQSIYARSKIVIVPTLVDETFCRVAFEAAANGIPVLSTRAGFIPYMLGDSGVYLPDDSCDAWIDEIRSLYFDDKKIAEIGKCQKEFVLKKFGKYPERFLDAVIDVASTKLPRKNIGFFTSWSDQGLGYQVRHYSHLLRSIGFKAHVFSFLPYKAIGTGLTNQNDTEDWVAPLHADSVYYSYNDREHVPVSEVSQFVRANRVGALIYPEICWDVNWRMLQQLSIPGLFVVGVPNLEIVRKGEANLHESVLSRTFCPTRAVEHILYSHGVRNLKFIGHGYGKKISDEGLSQKIASLEKRDFIRYLHIGGHNPKSRKQTPLVIEAFLRALKVRRDIRLTVTVMDTQSISLPEHENIDYVIGGLGHNNVMDLYKASDVSIQVSSHEGVGMGFYESLANGTPIISLDVPPHNEVVLQHLTGWLLKADLVSLPDNDDPVSRAARFEVDDLAQVILSLEKSDVAAMFVSVAKVHAERFDDISLQLRLLESLP